ncbi:hypothetical protein [Desulfitobacterium hafniense]|uniref:hypothetical protein n=1 Tax=Desulfitobacterium hafniense TaxID=49338 RepID=UPI001A9A32CD|nr:hypothetical protein [Desulfitobacterium hafniense]
MFNIGTYISQSESLDFLQNKYKNRKDQVSSLLESPEIIKKIELLKTVQAQIKSRSDKKVAALTMVKNAANDQVMRLEKIRDYFPIGSMTLI